MAAVPPILGRSTSITAPTQSLSFSKPKRVLACLRCQKRKIKCDRKFPCVHCKIADAQCVPATATSRGSRRRRFPERELLERLRTYEALLRRNNIKFEPLHKVPVDGRESPSTQGGDESEDEQVGADWPSPATTVKSESVYAAKNYWHALNSGGQRDANDDSDSSLDNLHQVLVKKSWVRMFGHNDHLLFGSPNINIDLSTLHPEPAQIFRLWQIYLDNVNPLLKVTHCITLQARIVEAAGNVKTIDPTLEALMFGIYCMSVQSLVLDDCQSIFGVPKQDLLTGFQFGCQQALQKCGFMRSSERECLTALYLYLISVRPNIVPAALCAMLGVAIRIAQRMGIHSEAALAKCSIFEAEMRRRLWWSLMLFDTRISEMADHQSATLTPTWDCNIPLNLNDSDLRPEMQEPPHAQGGSSDSQFAVVRSEVGEFIRHTHFHLDFTNPALKPILNATQHAHGSDLVGLVDLEAMIEVKYLKTCDQDNPLYFMTIWWTRAYIAKCRLMEYHSRSSSATIHQPDKQRDQAMSYAIRMIECDTVFNSSPLTKGFLWFIHLHFPFPAYLHILQELKRRPGCDLAEKAWEVMSINFDTLLEFCRNDKERPFFELFAKIILQAWQAREAAFSRADDPIALPSIVSTAQIKLAQTNQTQPYHRTQDVDDMVAVNQTFSTAMAMGAVSGQPPYNMEAQPELGMMDQSFDYNVLGNPPIDTDLSYLDWPMMDWRFGGGFHVA